MGYILHTVLHFVIGASITYMFFNRDDLSKGKRSLIMFFGGIAAVAPDFTKFFGDLLGHSIWLVGVFGLIITFLFRIIVKDITFKKSWLIFSLTVLIGHIFIDYIGNGVSLFYPFNKEEFDFHIVNEVDYLILFILSFALITGIFFQKGRLLIYSGILIVGLYLSILTCSKLQLEHALKAEYSNENISLLLTYPSYNPFQWSFQLRTDKVWYNGYSPIFNREIYIENERKVGE